MFNATYTSAAHPPKAFGSAGDRPGWHLPAAAAKPPHAPADAAGGPPGGPPVDPVLLAQQNAAGLSIGLGGAWDTYQQGQIGASYGNLDNPAADIQTNPYSQAALALTHYNNSTRGNVTSYAGRGQLYSGALQNAQEATLADYNQGLDRLKKGKQGALDTLTKGGLDRYSQAGVTLDPATLQSILKGLGR